jgi:hypothetical protein
MSFNHARLLLRLNATFLGGVGFFSLFAMDLRGIFWGAGPVAHVVALAPHAGIGFVEAHGLAAILSVLWWRATPDRGWHLTAVAAEVLLGTSNLVFWQLFVDADVLMLGYITTMLHWIFAALQLRAAASTAPALA